MKSKIFLSMLVIIVAVSLVAGGTMAWFTDAQNSANNTFTAGTVKINMRGDIGAVPLTVSNIAPGDTITKYVVFQNTGTLGMIFGTNVIAQIDEGNISQFLKVKITLNPSEGISWYGGFSPYGPAAGQLIYEGPITNLYAQYTLNNINAIALDPNYAAMYKFEITLDPAFTVQGATYQAQLHVDATQAANQDKNPVHW